MATQQKNQQGRNEKQSQGGRSGNHGDNRQENQGDNENRGNTQEDQSDSSNRGFAAMDDERQREIASKGGKAAHASGHAHEFTSEEARKAGRKGGQH
jgi:uncharacterized protein